MALILMFFEGGSFKEGGWQSKNEKNEYGRQYDGLFYEYSKVKWFFL